MELKPPRFVLLLLLAATLGVARLCAAGAVETQLDNDTNAFVPGAATTDRNYTFGTRTSWFAEPGAMPRWANRVAGRIGGAGDEQHRRFALAIGQEIYTPDAISNPGRIPDDRPYAGWLYGSALVASADEFRERSLEVRAGVVGPDARAEQAQSWWHRSTGVRAPRGWRWQLKNEPGLVASVQERWRPRGYRRFADVVPHARVSLGNVLTEAAAGLTLRLGWPLPDDFGPGPSTAPGTGGTAGERTRRAHLELFARTEGRVVARDIFLDGNTFTGGPRVHRVPLVGESQVGCAVRWRSLGFRYQFSYTTQEFRERADSHEYGSFAFSF